MDINFTLPVFKWTRWYVYRRVARFENTRRLLLLICFSLIQVVDIIVLVQGGRNSMAIQTVNIFCYTLCRGCMDLKWSYALRNKRLRNSLRIFRLWKIDMSYPVIEQRLKIMCVICGTVKNIQSVLLKSHAAKCLGNLQLFLNIWKDAFWSLLAGRGFCGKYRSKPMETKCLTNEIMTVVLMRSFGVHAFNHAKDLLPEPLHVIVQK